MTKKKKTLPTGITLRPNGQYRVRMSVDGHEYMIGQYHSLGDAKAALDIARGEKARGIFVPPGVKRARRKAKQQAFEIEQKIRTRTIRELAESWLKWLEVEGRAIGTIYTYRRRLEQSFLTTFEEWPVTMVTVEDVTRWYDNLVKSNGEGVAKQHYRTVDGMFRYATGQSTGLPRSFDPWIKDSPVDIPGAGRSRPAPRTEEIVVTPEEIAAIANHMPDRERLAVLLAGHCALRIGEVLGLRRRDITTDHEGTMWLSVNEQVQARGTGVRLDPPKTQAGYRDVPIPAVLQAAVKSHLKNHVLKPGESFLFARHETGNMAHHPNTFRGHFNTAKDKTGNPRLTELTFHGLRHSCLTRIGQAGATLADLMAYAGHSDVESVLIYQHSEKKRLASLSNAIVKDTE